MEQSLMARLARFGFKPSDSETMEWRHGRLAITAVMHPVKGLALLVSWGGRRSIGTGELYLSEAPSEDEIRSALQALAAKLARR